MFPKKRMNSRYNSLGKYWIPFFLCKIWINSSGRSIRNAFLNDTLVCTRVWRPSAHTVRPKTPESAVPVRPPSEAMSFHRLVPVRYYCRYRSLSYRSGIVVGRWISSFALTVRLRRIFENDQRRYTLRCPEATKRSIVSIAYFHSNNPACTGWIGNFHYCRYVRTRRMTKNKKPKSAHSRLTTRGRHLPVDRINGKPRPPSIGSTD